MSGHPDQMFGGETLSQHGEDLLIANLFWLLGVDEPRYLDIGCHHPWNISNTALLYKRGSHGVCVDANAEMVELFKSERPEDVVVCSAVGAERGRREILRFDARSGRNTLDPDEAERFEKEAPGFRVRSRLMVDVVTLDDIMEKYFDSRPPDFLSVDCEGMDYDILSASDAMRIGPAVVCVEARLDQGARMANMMGFKGYFVLARMGENLVFVRRELRDTVMGVA